MIRIFNKFIVTKLPYLDVSYHLNFSISMPITVFALIPEKCTGLLLVSYCLVVDNGITLAKYNTKFSKNYD